jgi:hypothetical protein
MIESLHYRERRWERPCDQERAVEQRDQFAYRQNAAKRYAAFRNLEIHFVKRRQKGYNFNGSLKFGGLSPPMGGDRTPFPELDNRN